MVLLWAALQLGVAADPVPPPNHAMLLGYYHADGRYGDFTSDWRPQFRDSL